MIERLVQKTGNGLRVAEGVACSTLLRMLAKQMTFSEKYPKKLMELRKQFENWEKEMEQAELRGPFQDY